MALSDAVALHTVTKSSALAASAGAAAGTSASAVQAPPTATTSVSRMRAVVPRLFVYCTNYA